MTPWVGDYSKMEVCADTAMFLEKRLSYTGTDIEYIGYNKTSNAPTSASTWLIFKLEYTGGNLVRYRLPNNGPQFMYDWDNRATFFI